MTLPGRVLAGSKKTKKERKSDFYPTPPWATRGLLEMVAFQGNILEPACGKGHICKVLLEDYDDVTSYDKHDRGYGDIKDFFTETRKFRNIVTNFPFDGIEKFLVKSKSVAVSQIAVFAKLVLLESQERYSFFQDRTFPLAQVLVFCERVTLALDGELESGGTIAYAWFLWRRQHLGDPIIRWIEPRKS